MTTPGIGDAIAVRRLAIQVYKSIHGGPQGYQYLLDDVSTMRIVLEQMESFTATLTLSQEENFKTIIDNCAADLRELQHLVEKYSQVAADGRKKDGSTKSKEDRRGPFGFLKTFKNRGKLGMLATEDTTGLRSRMIMHTSALATMVVIHVSTSSSPNNRLEFSDSEVLIVVLGGTGVGKSRFTRTATENAAITEGHGLGSETRDFKTWRFSHDNLNFSIVDTPGFNVPGRPDIEMIMELASFLETAFRAQFRVSGVVFMHSITRVRFDSSSLMNLRYLRKLCGTQTFHKTAFVTTFWDELKDEAIGLRREDELKMMYFKDEIEKGAKMRRFDGSRDCALGILLRLAGSKVTLDIQTELVDQQKRFHETAVGQLLQEGMKKRVNTLEQEQHAIAEMENQSSSDDIRVLQRERERLESQLAALKRQEQKLLSS